jgi:hypothetical protein
VRRAKNMELRKELEGNMTGRKEKYKGTKG